MLSLLWGGTVRKLLPSNIRVKTGAPENSGAPELLTLTITVESLSRPLVPERIYVRSGALFSLPGLPLRGRAPAQPYRPRSGRRPQGYAAPLREMPAPENPLPLPHRRSLRPSKPRSPWLRRSPPIWATKLWISRARSPKALTSVAVFSGSEATEALPDREMTAKDGQRPVYLCF